MHGMGSDRLRLRAALILRCLVLRCLALRCIAVLCMPGAVAAQDLVPELRIDRSVLDGSSSSNMLAPSSMALDAWRGMLYVLSDRATRVAVVDPVAARRYPDITLPGELRGAVELLAVNPRSRLLLLRERRGASQALLAVDVYTGAVTARFDAGEVPFLYLERDPERDELYLSRGTRDILRLDGSTLALLDSLSSAVPTAGLAVDSVHRVLYAAGARADSGTTTLTLYSTHTLERLRSYTLPADTPMTRVAVDPLLQNVALIGAGLIRLFDGSGLPISTERVSGGMGPHALSPTFHHLLYLDRAYAEGPGVFGTRRRLHRFCMGEQDFDSVAAGPGAGALAVIESAFEAAVLCSDAATVEVYDIFSFALKRTLRLGRSAESIAVSADGGALFVASATGPATVVTRVDLRTLKSSDHPMGGVPMQVERDLDSGRVVALLAHEHRFLVIDPETGVTERSFLIPDVGVTRDSASPSFALGYGGVDDLMLALFPEQNLQALVNIATGERLRLAYVDGYAPAPYAGAGALQGVFLNGTRQYAILRLRERKVNLYRVDRPGLDREIDCGGLDWSRIEPFGRYCLRQGLRGDDFFVGPYRYDAVGNRWLEPAPETTLVVWPCDEQSCIALQKTSGGDALNLLQLTRDSLRVIRSTRLLRGYPVPDAAVYHPVTRRLFLSFSDSGLILVFSIDEGSEVPAWSKNATIAAEAYPNPASLSRHGFLVLRLEAGGSAILVDMLGRVLWKTETADHTGGLQRIPLRSVCSVPGSYILRMMKGTNATTVRIQILP